MDRLTPHPEADMNTAAYQLQQEVYLCEHCKHISSFQRPRAGQPFYKFPPIIGAQEPAPLLFVGINPRRSRTNLEIHDWLMRQPKSFSRLAGNRQDDGRDYIAIDGEEEHYRCHATIVNSVFGAQARFESKAAVTELYLCASESGSELLDAGKSLCAARYLARVLGIVKPSIVIAVGWKSHKHLEDHFSDIIDCESVQMEHPRYLRGLNDSERKRRLQPTINIVVDILNRLRP